MSWSSITAGREERASRLAPKVMGGVMVAALQVLLHAAAGPNRTARKAQPTRREDTARSRIAASSHSVTNDFPVRGFAQESVGRSGRRGVTAGEGVGALAARQLVGRPAGAALGEEGEADHADVAIVS